ncbi:ABC transporter permease [Sunxiuqinia elliptica]|uniref:Lipoprotein-releasing system permease protein n=1 Tax=Sunxiuqinia elliptica TaxID=655355 RepID=A0A4R6H8I2_9BACT|nr:FtsX-like permease family protein [Sunxiuqinia elliptica]TDO04723.1 lipoprotein-releasing system permease protein [Sunxiuqinia elliptica]TDO64271.1 lipoprotein-releasing system permease protein [Sunxiuqinia elliptica]
MNTELFIAKRLFSSKDQNQRMSRRIVRLAVAGISLGMVVMILAVAIVTGFQREIESKVNGFAAHLQIVNYDSNLSYQTEAINKEQGFLEELRAMPQVKHVQQFATKPGMIKTDEDIQGVVLKGIAPDFDWSFFDANRVAGERIALDSLRTNAVWISEQLSNLLKLGLGDSFRMYFLNENERVPRIRQFEVKGIYRTGLAEFDRMFMLIDIRHLQRLNGWADDEISGYEIFMDDLEEVDNAEFKIRDLVLAHLNDEDSLLRVINIKRKFPHIFDWLRLLDMNVWIILSLMVLVAGFNMISGLLVIILERTQMIGVLKSLGAANVDVRKVFLYLSAFLIGEGLLWGNVLGILLGLAQHYFQIIHLDPASYYVDTVPVNISVLHLVLLNIGALLVTMLMLIAPSFFISRIAPEKTIRFD